MDAICYFDALAVSTQGFLQKEETTLAAGQGKGHALEFPKKLVPLFARSTATFCQSILAMLWSCNGLGGRVNDPSKNGFGGRPEVVPLFQFLEGYGFLGIVIRGIIGLKYLVDGSIGMPPNS